MALTDQTVELEKTEPNCRQSDGVSFYMLIKFQDLPLPSSGLHYYSSSNRFNLSSGRSIEVLCVCVT